MRLINDKVVADFSGPILNMIVPAQINLDFYSEVFDGIYRCEWPVV